MFFLIQEYVKGNAEGNNESILNPFQDSAKNFEEVLFDVETVLRKYRKSQMVFDKYLGEVKQNQGFYRPLFKKERKAIVGAITDWLILEGVLLRRSDYLLIVDKIKEVFPREASFIYYKPSRIQEMEEHFVANEENFQADEVDKIQEPRRKMKNAIRKTPPSGLLYSAYRYRITKKREEAKENKQSCVSFYR